VILEQAIVNYYIGYFDKLRLDVLDSELGALLV
jgi:hypothetical protein